MMGYFGIYWHILLGYLAFQVALARVSCLKGGKWDPQSREPQEFRRNMIIRNRRTQVGMFPFYSGYILGVSCFGSPSKFVYCSAATAKKSAW